MADRMVIEHNEDGRLVARKRARDATEAEQLRHERTVLGLVAGPGVVRLATPPAGVDAALTPPDGATVVEGAASAHVEVIYAGRDVASAPPDSVDAVVGIVADVAEALERAHAAGVSHGRVDPSHILVDGDGAVSLCGWSRAAVAGSTTSGPFNPEQDVAQLGAVLADLLAQLPPARRGVRRKRAQQAQTSGAALAAAARQPNPQLRPSLAQLRHHLQDLREHGASHPAPRPGGQPAPSGAAQDAPEPVAPDGGHHAASSEEARSEGATVPAAGAAGPAGEQVAGARSAMVEAGRAGPPGYLSWPTSALGRLRDARKVALVAGLAAFAAVVTMVGVGRFEPGTDPASAAGQAPDPVSSPSQAPSSAEDPPPQQPPVMAPIGTLGDPSQLGASRDGAATTCPERASQLSERALPTSCIDRLSVSGREIGLGPDRFVLGQEGDVVAVADLACRGSASAVLLRPGSGELWLFPVWAGKAGATARASGRFPGTVGLARGTAPCGEVVLVNADGTRTVVDTKELPT